MKRLLTALLCAGLLLGMTSCAQKTPAPGDTTAGQTQQTTAETTEKTTAADSGVYDLSFSAKDEDASYDADSCKIVFSGSGAAVSGQGAAAQGTTVTISEKGTYILSGSCSDGRVHISAGASDDVQLVLDGLELSGSASVITADSADKVILTLASGSVNTLADSGSYALTVGGSEADATVFIKTDLTINGSGSLRVTGNYKHGIVSKDDLAITGGDIQITAVNTGMEGKDSVRVKNASLTVSAGTDGIRSTNTEQTDRGYVYIESGNLQITSGNDGMQAVTLLRCDSGNISVTSGGSQEGASAKGVQPGFDRGFYPGSSAGSSTDTQSTKGLKSAGNLEINGSTLVLDCCDDAIHANGNVTVQNGDIRIQTGDDGIHADSALTVQDGSIQITQSYEGLEGSEITLNGGRISVVSADDGVNAAGGNDSEKGFDPFAAESGGSFTVNGGYLLVNASGDGLDSNGSIRITGGTVLVSGAENDGNAALDYSASAEMTGGILIAAGSSGMAQSITGNGQGSIATNLNAVSGNVSLALTDENGTVLASFTPAKTYNHVVICAPGIAAGNTYSLVLGGTVSGADTNGFAGAGTLTGGETAQTLTLTEDNYGSSAFGGGFGGGKGNMGGRMAPGGMR